MIRRALPVATVLACAIVLTGCASSSVSDLPPRPALINHPVFFTLKSPDQADELIADCNERLSQSAGGKA